jgi:hypothetical protein
MGTITIKANICAPGGHIDTQASLNGVERGEAEMFNAGDIAEPITQDEIRIMMRTLIKVYRIGRTNAQVRTGLVAGFDVVVP